MTFLRISLILLLLVSCKKGVKFNPDFYVINKAQSALVNESGIAVNFGTPLAREFGCMHRNKIVELKMLLRNSRQLKSATVETMTDRKLHELILQIDKQNAVILRSTDPLGTINIHN